MSISRKRPTIGFLSANIHTGSARTLWPGIVDAARDLDANLLCFPGGGIGVRGETESQRNILYDLVSPDFLDGLVSWASTLGVALNHNAVVHFHQRFLPLPVISVGLPMENIPAISVDNYAGIRSAIVHLLEVHHLRRLAFIRGPESHYSAQERYLAFLKVMAEFEIEIDPRLISPPLPWESGAEAMRIFLEERGLVPGTDFEAVIAVSDLLALAAMLDVQQKGYDIPAQVAFVGFNNSTEGRLSSPPLTSVTLSMRDQGYRAVEELLCLIQGKTVPDLVLLPSTPVVRQSCGCPLRSVIEAGTGSLLARNPQIVGSECWRNQVNAEITQQLALPEWPARLLDVYEIGLQGGSPWIFLQEFERILRQAAAVNRDISAWQGAISILRRYSLPNLAEPARARCEDLCGQARVILGEVAQQAQAFHQLQAEQRSETLREIGQALITTFDVDKLAEVLADRLPRSGIASCYLAMYDNQDAPLDQSRLVLAFSDHRRIELEAGGQPYPTRQLVPPAMLPDRRFSMVVEPLFFHEEQIGFALFEVGRVDGSVLEVLRAEISSALKGALLFREAQGQKLRLTESEALLKELSIRDPLTGLHNRRFLEEALKREMQRAAEQQISLGVMMIDIDHFKDFNDHYGHPAGDELLRHLSALFRSHIRGSDVACRFGGEEFVLVLPDTTLEVTQARAEFLRDAARNLRVEYEGETLDTITISLGVALALQHGATSNAILKAADSAMYRAKAAGRDRVVVAG